VKDDTVAGINQPHFNLQNYQQVLTFGVIACFNKNSINK
jgi:hypothetical protein